MGLKILAITGRSLDSIGGAERNLARLCYFLAHECDVDIIAPCLEMPFRDYPPIDTLNIHIYDRNDLVREIRNTIDGLKYDGRLFDIIYLCDKICIKNPEILFLLKDVFPMAKIVFKETTVGKMIRVLNRIPTEEADKCLDIIDAVVCISSDIRDVFIQFTGFKGRIESIPNGIDTRLFSPVRIEEKYQIRSELGLPQDKPVYVFSGRFAEKKNLDIIYGAWLDMEKHKGDWAWIVFIGKPHKHYDEGVLRLIREDLKCALIRGPFQFDEELAKWYKGCDFYLAPTSREGLSNAFLEAAATGLYPVVSCGSGYKDIIDSEEKGMMVEERNTSEVIRQLNAIHSNPDEYRRRGRENLSKFIKETYDIRKIAHRYVDFFNSIHS